ncbi:MAG: DegT/DnrJ/EryC1/StrS aminotransferase family protein [Sphingorhabdus sp.]
MLNTPFAPWPSFTDEEQRAVSSILSSNRVNYWTGGEGREFEREFAAWAKTNHAVALANGTLALDLALKALEIGEGDEVIVTPRSFMASVSSVVNIGATPVFADVDRDSGNISPETIEAVLTDRTRAVIPVHLAGWPCDMAGIMALADKHDLRVIEDCAQAHGAKIDGKPVGGFGHIGAWSFCQDKIMTTGGEGGMVTTDDQALWSAMWSYKDHGKSWEAVYNREHAPGFRWVHESFGTNWRMLEMQSVIGRIQIKTMSGWTDKRTANAMAIHAVLCEYPNIVRSPLPPDDIVHAFYRHYGYVRPENLKTGWDRDRIVAEISARGGAAMQGTCSEIYREKAFDGTGLRPLQRLSIALELGNTSLAFLTHPTLTAGDMDKICSVLGEVLREASA